MQSQFSSPNAQFHTQLSRLQSEGIIQRVNYSEWATPIVVVKKTNGKVCICADLSTGLKSMLENHEYPLPVPEDLFTRLNGGKCFAKLDLADTYLQVSYNRIPSGVKTAPAIFQQIMDTPPHDIPGVAVYLDNALIMGSDPIELLGTFDKLFSRLKEAGFRLRTEKSTKFESEVHQILIESVRRLPVTAETISENTINEEILLEVMNYIQTKWPNGEISPKLRPFFNRHESLSIVDNCLMTPTFSRMSQRAGDVLVRTKYTVICADTRIDATIEFAGVIVAHRPGSASGANTATRPTGVVSV
ncbi:hypothetical protein X801_09113 [Opisthorchis viverrini]|uniref:Reverse transcriptase domain-containing protein n=1 Tax=Opisthorchis viverrini TaxID=6198 RepID=A0A1S8WKY6_OPIVI|nr:hypothetical protein X801_09113 [Opisthorchis viverrini]